MAKKQRPRLTETIIFRTTKQERHAAQTIADREDRKIAAVARRLFRKGLEMESKR